MSFLSGYKTYIIAVILGLVTVALSLGWINDETAKMLYGLFGAGGLWTLRAGMKKE